MNCYNEVRIWFQILKYWTFPLNDLYLTIEFRYVNWTDSDLDSSNSMFKNRLHGRLLQTCTVEPRYKEVGYNKTLL